MIRVSASTNPSTNEKLVDYAKKLQAIEVDFLHCDVMDGKFVSNVCLPINVIKKVHDNTLLPLDIHLMVDEPLKQLKEYLKLKPVYVTIHYEAFKNEDDIVTAINTIHNEGSLVGLSIKPRTLVADVEHFLQYIDLLLIMGVEPGKSGQKTISNTYAKVKQVRSIIYKEKLNLKIQVDGGVNESNLKKFADNGVDIVVVGKALFDSLDKRKFVKIIHNM